MPCVKLQSSDDEIVETDLQIAQWSGTIKAMLDGRDIKDGDDVVLQLPTISSDVLRKILCWINFHKHDPQPENDASRKTDNAGISAWDADFLKVDQDTLLELILAANYLDIKGLLNAVSKMIADLVGEETTDEIRETSHVEDDFTRDEEKQLRREDEGSAGK